MNNLLTSDAGTGPPIHGTQPGDSGCEGLLSLQTTFPRPPRITAALSVHWLCQTPKYRNAHLVTGLEVVNKGFRINDTYNLYNRRECDSIETRHTRAPILLF